MHDHFTDSQFGSYAMFVLAITGLYQSAKMEGVSPKSIEALRVGGNKAIKTLLLSSETASRHYLIGLSNGDPSESMLRSKAEFMCSMQKVANDNLNELVLRAKGALVTLNMTDSPAMTALMQKHINSTTFQVRDKSGKKWQADRYVKTLTRQFSVNAALDAKVEELAEKGDLAKIDYDDTNHEGHGLIVSLTGATPNVRTLAAVRAKVFHPYSKAKLVSYVHA